MATLSRSFANRGMWLEHTIMASAELAARRGEGQLAKLATPYVLPSAGQKTRQFIRRPSTVDCVGVAAGIPVAFDVKSIAGKSLPFSKVKDHQVAWLDGFRLAGGIAGLVISFQGQSVWLVDVTWWIERQEYGPRSVNIEEIRDIESSGYSAPLMRGARGYPLDWVEAVRTMHRWGTTVYGLRKEAQEDDAEDESIDCTWPAGHMG